MNDLISRQAAISALTDEAECNPWDYSPLDAILTIKALPSAEPGRKKPEQPESAKEYCEECEHIEMCSWYPYEGCEFRDIGTYARGYNDAKREIALSGEYERAYQRGKADAERKKGRPYLKKIGGEYGYWACSQCHEPISICANYCSHCGAKMGGDADADTN